MAIFGLYFVRGLLEEMGWPRKQGLLGARIVDTTILDAAVDQMVDWAASIGAGRSRLALQIIARELEDKDWEGSDAPDMRRFVEKARSSKIWGTAPQDKAPHEIIKPVRFSKRSGSSITAKKLTDRRLAFMLEHMFYEGLLYGLFNPDQFERWYKKYIRKFKKSLPQWKEAGLDIDKPRTLDEYYADGESIIHDYERDLAELPSIPPKLFNDAKELGVKI